VDLAIADDLAQWRELRDGHGKVSVDCPCRGPGVGVSGPVQVQVADAAREAEHGQYAVFGEPLAEVGMSRGCRDRLVDGGNQIGGAGDGFRTGVC
jgi:hypothetical protein